MKNSSVRGKERWVHAPARLKQGKGGKPQAFRDGQIRIVKLRYAGALGVEIHVPVEQQVMSRGGRGNSKLSTVEARLHC